MTVKTTAQMLQRFGTDLAETELPNDVQCTKDLLTAHTEKHDKLQVVKLAVVQVQLLSFNETHEYIDKAQGNKDKTHEKMCHDGKTEKDFSSVLQSELKLAMKQGTTLFSCIKDQANKAENHPLNPDEMENLTTVERWAKNCSAAFLYHHILYVFFIVAYYLVNNKNYLVATIDKV